MWHLRMMRASLTWLPHEAVAQQPKEHDGGAQSDSAPHPTHMHAHSGGPAITAGVCTEQDIREMQGQVKGLG